MDNTRYINRPDQYDALLRILGRGVDPVFIDTEYETNDDFGPAFNADIHVWSIGWPATDTKDARGIRRARAVVLPASAMFYEPMREWLESPARKWAHNAGVDRHAFANAGVLVGGVRDSLSLFRLLAPWRADPTLGFSLDALGVDFLGPGRGKSHEFRELVSRPRVVTVTKREKHLVCSCGTSKCRKRTGHTRTEVVTETQEQVTRGKETFPLSEIVEGHPRWDDLVVYSGRDVIVGCELIQYAERLDKPRELPW